MCAIAGCIGLHADEKTLERMLSSMKHRGPDGQGIFREEDHTLLHTRLAIIDASGGAQPMELSWGGERYTIVYNGELYNTEELRKELKKRGHRFTGYSDTEVLLHAYGEYGQGCLEMLNGIFAFAVWEHQKKRLFLARDRIGVKPLFYKRHQGGLLFASEIKTILAYPGVRAELDGEGAAEILLLGPGRTPGCGVFRGIRELEPGCCASYQAGRLMLQRYWMLKDREHKESFEETAQIVRELVVDAIRRQMVSDVPIGTLLSGGLDSSVISAVCAAELAKSGQRLKTFSVDYADNDKFFVPGKFQPEADGHYIHVMQEFLNSQHYRTVLTPGELLEQLEESTIARDLPGMADVDFSLHAFCKDIRKEVKVALSGECADEIFGGYPWYRDPEIRRQEGFPWAQSTARRALLMHPDQRKKLDPEGYIRQRYETTCAESHILTDNSPTEKRMKEMVNLNFRWFMQTLLDRKDRMSMHSALEVRVPFCDWRIAEYLYAVPWEYKDYQGKEKGLLRHAMEGILPNEVLWRKKSPYPKTWHPEYSRLVRQRMEALLGRKDAPLFELVDRSGVKRLLEEESPWPWYGQLMKTPQTIAYLLQVNFWLEHYAVDVLL